MIPPAVEAFIAEQLDRTGWRHAVGPAESWGPVPAGAALRAAVALEIDEAWLEERARALGADDAYFRPSMQCCAIWLADPVQVLSWTCDPAALQTADGPPVHHPLGAGDAFEKEIGARAALTSEHVFTGAQPTRKLDMRLWTLTWRREVDGVEVYGDGVYVVVNTRTGCWVSHHRGRCAPLPDFGAPLPLDEARAVAEAWLAENAPQARSGGFDPWRSIVWIDGRYRRVWKLPYGHERPLTAEERAEQEALAALPPPPTAPACEAAELPECETLAQEDEPERVVPTTTGVSISLWVADDGRLVHHSVQGELEL